MTYFFVVRNIGDVALTNVTVTDLTLTPTYSTTVGILATNQAATVSVARAISGSLTNTATARGQDPLGRDHTDTDTAQVRMVLGGIMGSVFLDVDGDGLFDPEDTNGIAGVTITLLNAGSAVVGVATTDIGGSFGFYELPPGDYTVVETDLPGYISTGDVAPPNDNRIPVSLPGSGLVPGNDFLDTLPAAVGDHVWNDLNANGLHDEDLRVSGLDAVRVYLYRVTGGATVYVSAATTTTNLAGERGYYLFDGLLPGEYLVQVETSDIPTSLSTSTTPGSYRPMLMAEETVLSADFGFTSPATPVTLAGLTASREDGGVRVAWETAAEIRNLGFHVYRSASPDGEKVCLTAGLIAGLGTGDGRAYEFVDAGADPAATLYYWVEDVSWDFETERHGPAVVYGEESGSDEDPALASFELEAQPALYRVRYEALKAAGVAIDAIDPAALKVLVDGEETALFVSAWRGPMKAGDYLLFYAADGVAEIRTGAEALRMEEVYAGPADDAGDAWYGAATEEGTLAFETQAGILRYLLIGFTDEQVHVLDVTATARPKLLYGYSRLQVNGEAGVYLGCEAAGAKLLAVGDHAVREVEFAERP